MATSLDSREVKTTDPDPQTEGEEGEVVETQYFLDPTRVHLYGYSGTGAEITTGVLKDGNADGIGTFELKDIRDNKTYLTRRLADGNCWMVQNLDLALADFADTENLTSENTDLNSKSVWDPSASVGGSSNFAAYSLEKLGVSQQYQYQPYGTQGTIGNTIYHWGSRFNESRETLDGTNGSPNNPTMQQIGNTGIFVEDNSKSVIPRSYDDGADWIDNSASNNNGSPNNYKSTGSPNNPSEYLGSHYNWYATVAEVRSFGMTGTAEDSICPYGWQLPADIQPHGDRSWQALIGAYSINSNVAGSRSLRSFPLSAIMSGYYRWVTGDSAVRGEYGQYWSSEYAGTLAVRYLFFGSDRIEYTAATDPIHGVAVRCVAHGTEIQSEASKQAEAVATTCAAKSICYDANGGTGSMDNQGGNLGNNASVVLNAPTFTRLGYSFAGWSTQDNGFGTVYGPNETITTPSNMTSTGLRLYAKWLPSSGTMQTFTAQQCADLGEHQSIALTDNRDGNVYTVTKLKDGNCWMTTNLALNLADFAGDNPKSGYLTTENTDIGNDSSRLDPLTGDLIDLSSNPGGNSGVLRWDPEKSTRIKWETTYASELQSRGLTQDFTGLSELLLGQAQPAQFQSADQIGYWWGSKVSDDGAYSPLSDVAINSNTELPRSYVDSRSLYGVIYNWYSATAESGHYADLSEKVNDSVCPSGWQLPNSYSDRSWDNLFRGTYQYVSSSSQEGDTAAIALEKMRKNPFSIVFSGLISWANGRLNGSDINGGYGYYWTSLPSEANNKMAVSYDVDLSHKKVRTAITHNKAEGYSVRCVRKAESPSTPEPEGE